MNYKLIDVRTESEEEVEFGTCELCMSVGTLEYAVAVVEDEEGNTHEFENGYWSWGSWFEYSYDEIENVIDFASWFSKQELSELDASSFWGLVDKYNDEKRG
jgi:hypothetical protein